MQTCHILVYNTMNIVIDVLFSIYCCELCELNVSLVPHHLQYEK